MAEPAGMKLLRSIAKGYRPLSEAMEDEKYLQENEATGERWHWVDREGNTVYFTS